MYKRQVFDVRPSGASFTGETIERVNIHTGEVEVIYRASQGAHVGLVTVHPKSEQYVFILSFIQISEPPSLGLSTYAVYAWQKNITNARFVHNKHVA
ncbi:DUF3748 domain-containing protein [Listeria monocytogenes]|nr:DUF3748 domain-containing protein [Listeria monocytogenes]